MNLDELHQLYNKNQKRMKQIEEEFLRKKNEIYDFK